MLYVNGCSYAGYSPWSWGHNLSRMLGTDIYFAAKPGKSNQAIVRETVNDLINYNNITHVVISLSFINRFDICYNQEILSINPSYNADKIKNDVFQNYFKYKTLTDSSKLQLLDLFSSLVTLKYFVEAKGIKFFVFWAANELDVLADPEIKKLLMPAKKILDNNSFSLFDFSFCSYSFNENYINHSEKHLNSHAHPPPAAHKKLAEMLYNCLK